MATYKTGDSYTLTGNTSYDIPFSALKPLQTVVDILNRCGVDFTVSTVIEYAAQDINELYKDVLAAALIDKPDAGYQDETSEEVTRSVKQIFKDVLGSETFTPTTYSQNFAQCIAIDEDERVGVDRDKMHELFTITLVKAEADLLNAIEAAVKAADTLGYDFTKYINLEGGDHPLKARTYDIEAKLTRGARLNTFIYGA